MESWLLGNQIDSCRLKITVVTQPEAQTVSSKGLNFLDISMSLPGAQVVVTVTVYGV